MFWIAHKGLLWHGSGGFARGVHSKITISPTTVAAAATRAHAVRATDGVAEQRLRGARDGRRGGAATAPAVAAPSVPETCALVQGVRQEGGKCGGAGRAAAAASSRALRAQWGGRARAQRVTGQGSSPHPAVAFERRLSHACAGAAGRSAVGRDGAVPAAGRVQGAGAENPAHSAPAEAADRHRPEFGRRVESFSWPRVPPYLRAQWELARSLAERRLLAERE